MVDAIVKELSLQQSVLKSDAVNTVYFGGGTPSLLTTSECERILACIRQHYNVAKNAEITLEANPDDITEEKSGGWKAAGINRLSVGVQSFAEEELRWMNRAHNATQAISCIHAIRAAGFDNYSIDLIYGSPLLSDAQWEAHVKLALSLDIPHLSCYALTVEEKTPLHKKILLQQSPGVENEKQAQQFLLLMQWLREAGYEHYEVSNFAKPGVRSRHNSSYWKGVAYLGIGPSAHSFDGTSRSWNVANNTTYIQSLSKGLIPAEKEVLTAVQQLNEYIMISLRTKEGLDLDVVAERWNGEATRIRRVSRRFVDTSLVKQNGSFLQLTDEGMLRADGIAAELFGESFEP